MSLSYSIDTSICIVSLHLLLIHCFYSRIPSKYAGEDAPEAPGTLSAAAKAPKQAPKTPPPSETPPASSLCYLRKVAVAVDAAEDVEEHNRHRKEITGWELLHLRPRKFNKLLRKVAVAVEGPSRYRRRA